MMKYINSTYTFISEVENRDVNHNKLFLDFVSKWEENTNDYVEAEEKIRDFAPEKFNGNININTRYERNVYKSRL